MIKGTRSRGIAFCSALLFLGWAICGRAEAPRTPSIDQLMDSLFEVRTFKETVISFDGSWVAWVERLHGKDHEPSENTMIFVTPLSSTSKPRRITAGDGTTPYSEHDPAWSPDGHHLAFLSDREEKGQSQLYLVPAEGGATRQLTHVKGLLAAPQWSPDGKTIAVLFTENLPRSTGPLEAKPPVSGLIEGQIFEQRIAIVDSQSGRIRQISPADLYVYEYDWSPDGKTLVATAAHGDGDNNWWIAQICTITVDTGETKSIFKPSLQVAVPRWSPDGKAIAFISGLMSDQGVTGGDVFVVPSDGGEPVNLTPEMKASASWLHWLPSSNQLLFEENVEGETGIARVDVSTHQITTVWRGAETISSFEGWTSTSVARNGKTSAVIRSSLQLPPEVWAGEIGAWKQITHLNASLRPMWGEAKSLHWTSDGMNIQGWLLYPYPYDARRKYPLVVYVHGGPSSMHRLAWPDTFFDFTALSSEGYFVLFPNPRGSFGAGEGFTRANVKDFGYGDFHDILAGVDEVTKNFPIDPNRTGIGGWSYGGFMTMWGVTQTQRFHAAVAGAGIMNWQSYYGENGIDQWMIPFFGASVYDNPAVYARSAPITFIKEAKTPTLVLVGDSDVECPTPQSFEFWHALKTLGVKTQMVVYKDEGHLIAQPKHRLDIMKRTIDWFNENLK
jgi:dipeptidyl aminopeptidase/acylaminoacyl peptidase